MSKQLESILSRATSATPKPVAVPAAEAARTAETTKAPAEKPKLVAKPEPKAEPQKPLQAHVPASVARAVNIKAAEEGTTVRNIILQGLKAVGIDIPEEELRDRRR